MSKMGKNRNQQISQMTLNWHKSERNYYSRNYKTKEGTDEAKKQHEQTVQDETTQARTQSQNVLVYSVRTAHSSLWFISLWLMLCDTHTGTHIVVIAVTATATVKATFQSMCVCVYISLITKLMYKSMRTWPIWLLNVNYILGTYVVYIYFSFSFPFSPYPSLSTELH